jgi:hypothetical protein
MFASPSFNTMKKNSNFISGINYLMKSKKDVSINCLTEDLSLIQELVYVGGGSIAIQTARESGTDYQFVYQLNVGPLSLTIRCLIEVSHYHLQLAAWGNRYQMFAPETKLTIIDNSYFV